MSKTPAEIEADIARQREQLAATVNELQEQVQTKAQNAKDTARQAAIVAGALLVVVVVVAVVKRRRRS